MAEFDYESTTVGKYIMPAAPHSSGEVYVNTGKVAIDVNHTLNDMIGLCVLPKGCVPIDFVLRSDNLESGTSQLLTMSVGISKAARSDLAGSTTIISGSTVPQDGGTDNVDLTVSAAAVFVDAEAKNKDRIIAAKITAKAHLSGSSSSVNHAVAGDLMGELYYRACEPGEWSATPSSIA